MSIFSDLIKFFSDHDADIASKVIASMAYDQIKPYLDFSELKAKIAGFFKSDQQAEHFLDKLVSESANNPAKPIRDLEDLYESETNEAFEAELGEIFKQWIKENQHVLESIPNTQVAKNSGISVGVQNAGNNIYNIKGDFKPKKG